MSGVLILAQIHSRKLTVFTLMLLVLVSFAYADSVVTGNLYVEKNLSSSSGYFVGNGTYIRTINWNNIDNRILSSVDNRYLFIASGVLSGNESRINLTINSAIQGLTVNTSALSDRVQAINSTLQGTQSNLSMVAGQLQLVNLTVQGVQSNVSLVTSHLQSVNTTVIANNASLKLQMETNITQVRNEASADNQSNNAKINSDIQNLNSSLYANMLNRSQESSLNVNSTTWFASITGFYFDGWLKVVGNALGFNQTRLESTFYNKTEVNSLISDVNVSSDVVGLTNNISVIASQVQTVNTTAQGIQTNLTLTDSRLQTLNTSIQGTQNNLTEINTTLTSRINGNNNTMRDYVITGAGLLASNLTEVNSSLHLKVDGNNVTMRDFVIAINNSVNSSIFEVNYTLFTLVNANNNSMRAYADSAIVASNASMRNFVLEINSTTNTLISSNNNSLRVYVDNAILASNDTMRVFVNEINSTTNTLINANNVSMRSYVDNSIVANNVTLKLYVIDAVTSSNDTMRAYVSTGFGLVASNLTEVNSSLNTLINANNDTLRDLILNSINLLSANLTEINNTVHAKIDGNNITMRTYVDTSITASNVTLRDYVNIGNGLLASNLTEVNSSLNLKVDGNNATMRDYVDTSVSSSNSTMRAFVNWVVGLLGGNITEVNSSLNTLVSGNNDSMRAYVNSVIVLNNNSVNSRLDLAEGDIDGLQSNLSSTNLRVQSLNVTLQGVQDNVSGVRSDLTGTQANVSIALNNNVTMKSYVDLLIATANLHLHNWLNITGAPAFITGDFVSANYTLITTTSDIQTNVSVIRSDVTGIQNNVSNLNTSKLDKTDERFNETTLVLSINTTTNIMSLDFYNKSEIDSFILVAGNSSWNKTYADTLYYAISNPNEFINLTGGQVLNDSTQINALLVNISNGVVAYSWGNHSLAGYLLTSDQRWNYSGMIEGIQNNVSVLQSTMSDVQTNVSIALANNVSMGSRVGIVENTVGGIQTNLSTTNGLTQSLNSTLQSVQGNVSVNSANIVGLQNNLSNQVALQSADNSSMSSRILSSENNIVGVQNNLSSVSGNVQGVNSTIQSAQSNISVLQSTVSKVQSNLSTARSDISGIQSNVSTLQTTVADVQSNLSNQITRQSADNSSMRAYADAQDVVFNLSQKTYIDEQDVLFNVSAAYYADSKLPISDQRWNYSSTIEGVQDNVSALRTDMTGVQNNVSGLRSDLNGVQSNVSISFGNNVSMKKYVDDTAGLLATNLTEVNESLADYIPNSAEGNLNVNSTTWWAGLQSFSTVWFYNLANALVFNQSKLESSIGANITSGIAGLQTNISTLNNDINTLFDDVAGIQTNLTEVNNTLSNNKLDKTDQSFNETGLALAVNATANTKAKPGDCAAGSVVMNTTTGGVQCVLLPAGADISGLQQNISIVNSTLSGRVTTVENTLGGVQTNLSGQISRQSADNLSMIAYIDEEITFVENDNLADNNSMRAYVNAQDIAFNLSQQTYIDDEIGFVEAANFADNLSMRAYVKLRDGVANLHLHDWLNITNTPTFGNISGGGSVNDIAYFNGFSTITSKPENTLNVNTSNYANNAGMLNNNIEINLNVNSSFYASNAGMLNNKIENNLNVNSSFYADNAGMLNNKIELNLNVNSSQYADNAGMLNGKIEQNLNVNNSLLFASQPFEYYNNWSNFNTFPSSCSPGQFLFGVGTTFAATCSAPSGTSNSHTHAWENITGAPTIGDGNITGGGSANYMPVFTNSTNLKSSNITVNTTSFVARLLDYNLYIGGDNFPSLSFYAGYLLLDGHFELDDGPDVVLTANSSMITAYDGNFTVLPSGQIEANFDASNITKGVIADARLPSDLQRNISVADNSTAYLTFNGSVLSMTPLGLSNSHYHLWVNIAGRPVVLSNLTNDWDLINSTFGNATYLAKIDEPNLNVNSSVWWAELDDFIDGWLMDVGTSLGFNETLFNASVDGKIVASNSTMKNYVDSTASLLASNLTEVNSTLNTKVDNLACSDITNCVDNALASVVEDTTPQLGGNLDGQAYNITTQKVCLNIACTSYILNNGTHTVIR